jgi:hypothetical protein
MWLRENGTPYYVGKGSGDRACAWHKRMGNAPKGRVIAYIALDESDAFETEKLLIWYYGRKDLGTGCLRNLSDGGENPPKQFGNTFAKGSPAWNKGQKGVFQHTSETRSRMSVTRKEKTPITAWKTGHETWNKGLSPSAETLKKMGEASKGRPSWNKGLKGVQIAWNKGTARPEAERLARIKASQAKHKAKKAQEKLNVQSLNT